VFDAPKKTEYILGSIHPVPPSAEKSRFRPEIIYNLLKNNLEKQS